MAKKKVTTSKKTPRRKTEARAIVQQPAAQTSKLPAGYGELLTELKDRIRTAQVKAALSVNRELIELYWHIGQKIVQRQEAEGWGQKVIDQLAKDLQTAFPNQGGFSRANIYRMRQFFLVYRDPSAIVAQPVRQLTTPNLAQPARELQAPILPQVAAEIPWGHNVVLMEKVKDLKRRLWYTQKTIENGWSRAVLTMQIETRLYERQGQAVTNFQRTLPPAQSDLARALLKDPYNFDFLEMTEDVYEKELERELLVRLRQFLLELGAGFAFVGQQHHLEVGGEDFYLDLLFYHLKLRCFVVIDLKTTAFAPEHVGQMNFYLAAVDDLLRHPDDRPTVGLILCKMKNRVIAEYSLRGTSLPMGVSSYVHQLPPDLAASLPSIEQLQDELAKVATVSNHAE